jgi:hypothetical protein
MLENPNSKLQDLSPHLVRKRISYSLVLKIGTFFV